MFTLGINAIMGRKIYPQFSSKYPMAWLQKKNYLYKGILACRGTLTKEVLERNGEHSLRKEVQG